jgi:chemotaxis protein CheC
MVAIDNNGNTEEAGRGSLTELQLDTIREISNIGMGNAATALSQMVGTSVNIQVPRAMLVDIAEVPELMGGAEREVAASYVQVMGEARGHLVLAFGIEDSHDLIELIAPGAGLNLMEDDMARSAIQEVGNILSSSYLRSLAEITQLNLLPSVPAVAVDYAGSILTYVVSAMYEIREDLVLVQTQFEISGKTVQGLCLFVPEPGSLKMILDSLGVGGM